MFFSAYHPTRTLGELEFSIYRLGYAQGAQDAHDDASRVQAAEEMLQGAPSSALSSMALVVTSVGLIALALAVGLGVRPDTGIAAMLAWVGL